MTQKRKYGKTTMQVVKFEQEHELLAGSDGPQVGVQNYNWNNNAVE